MSWDINKVMVVGRLTRDPELAYTKTQVPYSNFAIAVGRGDKEASFFDVTAWDKTATFVSQYLRKGSQVIIEGSLQQQRWQAKDGANRTKVIINALQVQSVGNKPPESNQEAPAKAPAFKAPASPEPEFKDFEEDSEGGLGEDEIPF